MTFSQVLKRAAGSCALLLLIGCSPSIHDEIAAGRIERVRALLGESPGLLNAPDDLGKTPLHFAVTYGHEEIQKLLLDKGADIAARDITGFTPLHIASLMNRRREIELLLERGADIEARDDFEDTPLHTAAIHGRIGSIDMLLAKGADAKVLNRNGKTALALAEENRQTKAAAYLRQKGVGE